LLKLNRNFLNHNTYTDILTFPFHPQGQPIESDIYISIPRVRDNAIIHKVIFKEELLRVIFHGAIHLAGFSDNTISQRKRMTLEEDRFIKMFHVELLKQSI
jgi:rRNA maturation RNase YbeY